ncbi:MAG: TolC family protein [Myxococcales bacterium]|nr:TolC family protein [Myxococcales bacterium]
MFRACLAAAILAAAISPALAQPAPAGAPPVPDDPMAAFDAELGALLGQPGGLTAADAAARAARTSPAAARKRAETDAARTTVGTIKIALLPISKVSASYTRLSDVPDLRFAAPPAPAIEAQLNAFHLGYDLAIPLTDLIMRLPPAKKAAEDQVRATELSSQAAALDAGAQAEQLYYEWVRVSLATVVAERQVTQVEATRAQLAVLVEVQRASRADLLQLEAGKAQAELALVQLKQASAVLADQLRIMIGAGPDERLTIGDDIRPIDELPALADDATMVQAAMTRRYEARALSAATDVLAHHRRDTKVQRLPKLNVFGQLNYDQPNQRYFTSPDEFHLSWAAGVSLTWSPNDFLYTDPDLAAIDAQARAIAADRRGLEMSIEGQIASARSSLTLADAAYTASQRGLAAAAESYRVRQDLLANERATATELIVAEGALTQARLAAINALIDRRIAWAKLRHAAGLDVP